MPSFELLEIVGPALAAGLMIAMTHAPLGIEVLRRGIIFIDLAIAQMAGLGFVTAGLYMDGAPWWVAQSTALACAMLAGVFFRYIERKVPRQQEAVIGTSFILAASLALLLLADHPHGGEEVRHLLSGQVLFVTWPGAMAHAPVYAVILSLWFLRPSVRRSPWFYVLFSMAITSSVQLVGVYVVFASLIVPALSGVNAARPHITGWLCGVAAVVTGIAVSTWLDLPAGPFLVVAYVIMCLVVLAARRAMRLYREFRRVRSPALRRPCT